MKPHLKPQIFILILISFLLGGKILAQQYIWPTDASKKLTSVFGEFRPRHYHSAIDIKTWSKAGYKVFSIDDGEIFRIRVSPFGYGKALYVKLKDGNYVIVAHLERFNDKIEKFVREKQHRNGRYSIQLFPPKGTMKVKKGDLIAYSGETGIGVPHLHFEIRNPKNQPLNPLLFYPQLEDRIAPVIRRIAVFPQSDSSYIDGRPFPVVYEAHRTASGKYSIRQPINTTGPFTIGFIAWDKANGVNNMFSVYEFSLLVDDSMRFHAKYDYFDFEETRFIELDRNFALWREKRGKFQQTWLHRFNGLPFYQTDSDSGIISVEAGYTKSFNLITSDFNGNDATLNFQVSGVMPLAITPVNPKSKGSSINFDLGPWAFVSDLKIDPKNANSHVPRLIADSRGRWSLLLKKKNFDVVFSSDHLALEVPVSLNYHYETAPFKADVRLENDIIKGEVTFPKGSPFDISLDLSFFTFNAPIQVYRYGNKITFQKMLPHADGEIDLDMHYDGKTENIFSEKIYYISRDKKRVLERNQLKVTVPKAAFYDPAFIYWNKSKLQEVKSGTDFVSDVYSVEPFLEPLDRGMSVALIPPDSLLSNEHVGLFFLSKKSKWIFLAANEGGKCESRVLSLEKFALKIDIIPPIITSLTLAKKRRYKRLPKKFIWRVEDEDSGFPGDENFSCLLDGKPVIIEFDPEEDLLILPTFDLKINKGKHSFEISAEDNLNNRTTITNAFELY